MFNDFKEIITNNSQETFALGKKVAQKIKEGDLLCLEGELGSGKTTFTQGLLEGLGIRETVNSPTFVVMKEYSLEKGKNKTNKVYHIDTYRIGSQDMLDLGWEELVADKNSILIVEWPEKIREIIPIDSWWLKFEHLEGDRRKIKSRDYAKD